MISKRKIFLAVVLIVLISNFVLAASTQESVDSNGILLKSRQFTPTKGLSIYQNGKTHFLIQLQNFPTKEEVATFENAGIRLLDYIPNKAWFVSLSGELKTS